MSSVFIACSYSKVILDYVLISQLCEGSKLRQHPDTHCSARKKKRLEEASDIHACLLELSRSGKANEFPGGRQLRGTVFSKNLQDLKTWPLH